MDNDEARVLVVDDDEIIQGFLFEALADEGYDVKTAANGRQALAVLGSWIPDLIVLDLMMPEMDGWAFRAEQARRENLAPVPVIVLSATRDVERQAATLGAAGVFAKPFDLNALLSTVRDLVRTARQPGAQA